MFRFAGLSTFIPGRTSTAAVRRCMAYISPCTGETGNHEDIDMISDLLSSPVGIVPCRLQNALPGLSQPRKRWHAMIRRRNARRESFDGGRPRPHFLQLTSLPGA